MLGVGIPGKDDFAADSVGKTGEALRGLSEWIGTLNALQRRRATERTWTDVVQLFETRLGGVRLSATVQSGTLVPRLPVARLLEALYLELWGVATRGKQLRQCKRCARFFIRGREDQIFCTGPCARLWHMRRAGWKASTVAQYQQVLKSQLLPAFRDLRVSAITESRMRQLLTQLQDAGLSARRINLALLVLKMILRTAVRRRFLREDPASASRGPKSIRWIPTW